jgi:iron complex transport system ATP-binding protein
MNGFTIEGMPVWRGGRRLVDDLHCDAAPGSLTVILGPNGAGKSTLLQMLAGVLPGTGAFVSWQDKYLDAYGRGERADIVSWQGPAEYADFGLCVEERLHLSAGTCTGDEAGQMLRELDVHDLLARPLAQLSSGERQRVEVAAAMLRQTPVLLLDEPTAHLDLRHQAACLRLMRRQADAQGRIILAVLHDVAQAHAVADQAVLLYSDGRSETGPANEMLVPDRLEGLYGMPMRRIEGVGLLPDFRGMT